MSDAMLTRRQLRLTRRGRQLRALIGAIVVLLLIGGGYTIAVAVAPLPELDVVLSVDETVEIVADTSGAEAAVQAQSLPTAIGWAESDEVWSNDDEAYTTASLAKLVTVLVGLEHQPLEPGADGPTYVWTAADVQQQYEYLAMDGVVFLIPEGTKVTMRQMLTLILLPSANDFAAAYADWIFGDNDAFLAAVEEWKRAHGIESLSLAEPTGMDANDRANAADLVRITKLAMANPTITEFTGMQSAELPWGIGTVENTNPLLSEVGGVIGAKTGALSNVGFNLALAQRVDAFGREVTAISVTLARDSAEARAQSGRDMLALLQPLPQHTEVVVDNTEVGSVTTWTGAVVPLVTAGSASGVLLPGERITVSTAGSAVRAGEAGTTVGSVSIDGPFTADPVDVVTTAEIVEPDLWWRLTHPGALFGEKSGRV